MFKVYTCTWLVLNVSRKVTKISEENVTSRLKRIEESNEHISREQSTMMNDMKDQREENTASITAAASNIKNLALRFNPYAK